MENVKDIDDIKFEIQSLIRDVVAEARDIKSDQKEFIWLDKAWSFTKGIHIHNSIDEIESKFPEYAEERRSFIINKGNKIEQRKFVQQLEETLIGKYHEQLLKDIDLDFFTKYQSEEKVRTFIEYVEALSFFLAEKNGKIQFKSFAKLLYDPLRMFSSKPDFDGVIKSIAQGVSNQKLLKEVSKEKKNRVRNPEGKNRPDPDKFYFEFNNLTAQDYADKVKEFRKELNSKGFIKKTTTLTNFKSVFRCKGMEYFEMGKQIYWYGDTEVLSYLIKYMAGRLNNGVSKNRIKIFKSVGGRHWDVVLNCFYDGKKNRKFEKTNLSNAHNPEETAREKDKVVEPELRRIADIVK